MSLANYSALGKCAANYVPLSPCSFVKRAAQVYPNRPAVVYGARRYTWAETYRRAIQLASALTKRGLGVGDTVSIIAANTPEMVEAHYGLPMSGAVLNAINTRLDVDTVAYILEHGECELLITDSQFAPTVKAALAKIGRTIPVIDIVDEQAAVEIGHAGERLGEMTYEEFIETGDPEFAWSLPNDEWQSICLNYTSGTSGKPKGVVYHHRGAYLMAMGTLTSWLPSHPDGHHHPSYMYIVPMFHCNGWGHAWGMALVAGKIVCNRFVDAKHMYANIAEHRVTHFGGAPIVLSMLINAADEERTAFDWPIQVMTAGAPPPAAVLEAMGALGFTVTQVYGLTETYGHISQCCWQDEWSDWDGEALAIKKSHQGVIMPMVEAIEVLDQETGAPVCPDGASQGEIAIRGNTVMSGYYRNPEATAEVFADGYFRSGDVAVVHPDGYMQIKDRMKDIIISGGENISSVEVEDALYKHPAVVAAAVVARPDMKWGESPCAFIELRDGAKVSEADVIAHCRTLLAGFKCPKTVRFEDLPKTSTGKIQKFQLRERANALGTL